MSAVSKKRAFLEAFKASAGSITKAAAAVGIDRSMHYQWLEKDADYQKLFEQTKREAGQAIEDEAIRRAVQGVERPLVHRGRIVEVPVLDELGNPVFDEEPIVDAGGLPVYDDEGQPRVARKQRYKPLMMREYSDSLMQTLMRGWMPEKYGRSEITGPDGGPLVADVTVRFVKPSGS
jgi:hypothetical protein